MSTLQQDILELVRIPSVTGAEAEIAAWIEARLGRAGVLETHRLRRIGNSLVIRPRDEDLLPRGAEHPRRPWIVLAGHTDTVPQAEASEPAVREGRVYGRGTADMKSGLAVMLHLLEQLDPRVGFASRVFVFYAGEEGPADSNELRTVLAEEDWLGGADLAILLEPTAGALELGCQGSLHLEVTFQGKACHSARPWLGENAISKALPWLTAVSAIPPREVEIEGAVFREVASVTQIHGGETRNVIPGALRANLNLRYAPDRSMEDAERYVRSLAPASSVATAEIRDHAGAAGIDSAAPLYRHLLDHSGLPRRAKQAWTDVARFSALGVPALNWGPGDPAMAHTKDEWVEVAQAEQVLSDLRRFLLAPGPDGMPDRAR